MGKRGDAANRSAKVRRRRGRPEVRHWDEDGPAGGDAVLNVLNRPPFQTSVDLMGYGWLPAGIQPAISACDLAALAVVWDWVLTGSTTPNPPAVSEVAC